MQKLGRNDPCYCGSGRKYKKCCMASSVPSKKFDAMDEGWRKLRELEGRIIDKHLLPYTLQELPEEAWQRGLLECLADKELPEFLSMDHMIPSFFMPWFLFNWTAENEDFGLSHFDPMKTIAANYLDNHGTQLNLEEKRFIEVMNQTYYSFYCVTQVTLDQSLEVKDILLGTMHTVKERQATHTLTPGEIVFSRILTLNGQSIMVGMAPACLPQNCHLSILDFRDQWLKNNKEAAWTPALLREESQFDLLDCFFELLGSAYKPPVLFNTDNELLEFVKMTFKLSLSPEEALNALMPLTLSKDPNEFLAAAKRDRFGSVKSLQFPWLKAGNKVNKGWKNTVMGHLFIKKDRLILETNSQKRAKKGEKLLQKYLGKAITHEKSSVESPEKKLGALPRPSGGQIKVQSAKDELLKSPEVQEQIKAMMESHWKEWLDKPIPALQNKTPREAAKTTQGRERLTVLLWQFEHQNQAIADDSLKVDTRYLKSELGMI